MSESQLVTIAISQLNGLAIALGAGMIVVEMDGGDD